jgi:saccharopine dehydrogenase (NAD+, L-lysine-forming)
MNTILLLGGYGRCGRRIARRLLQETDVALVIAGRHLDRAGQLATELNKEMPGGRVSARAAEAADPGSLHAVLDGVRLVVACTSTTEHIATIADAALACGADYLDLHFPAGALKTLQAMAPKIERAGRCFITQGGFHPGLLAPLVRFAAPRFGRYRTARLGLIMNFHDGVYRESAREFMEEAGTMPWRLCRNGGWQPAGFRDRRKVDFGPGFGVRKCVPLDFAELHGLPRQLGLEEVACYVAGFNWFVDGVLFPLAFLFSKIKKGFGAACLGRAWVWAMNRIARPPYGVQLQLEAEGEAEGRPQTVQAVLRHPDIHEFTAIPVVACLKQYLDGSIARPGLWLMGEAVEPARLFRDLEQMGVRVEMTGAGAPPKEARPVAEAIAGGVRG